VPEALARSSGLRCPFLFCRQIRNQLLDFIVRQGLAKGWHLLAAIVNLSSDLGLAQNPADPALS
jgi:hypothetical protein